MYRILNFSERGQTLPFQLGDMVAGRFQRQWLLEGHNPVEKAQACPGQWPGHLAASITVNDRRIFCDIEARSSQRASV
jgi:hypothetical protein